jgi:phosphatidylserine/phosphatidylglycerophosphate/cardiolipin synthase-like enzyme
VLAVMSVSCAVRGETATAPAVAPTPPVGALSALIEPDQGIAPIYALLASAKRSVDLTMYELVDPQAENALEQAAGRGVVVRVILDGNREKAANKPAYAELAAHRVHVVWADSRYAATHEKAVVVDRAVAAVMSLNLTARYYPDTRDFAVLDRQPADVQAIEAVFDADFNHHKVKPAPGNDLVWSPGVQDVLLSLIDSATSTLLVENEEMALPAVTTALERAAGRGVHVTVVMTRQDDWAADFEKLAKAHVDVRTYAPTAGLYIHAKAIVVDDGTPGAKAFVGSQNFSSASLNHNRELGLLTADPELVGALAKTIRTDAASASHWKV